MGHMDGDMTTAAAQSQPPARPLPDRMPDRLLSRSGETPERPSGLISGIFEAGIPTRVVIRRDAPSHRGTMKAHRRGLIDEGTAGFLRFPPDGMQGGNE
jgi:hypothetical protein